MQVWVLPLTPSPRARRGGRVLAAAAGASLLCAALLMLAAAPAADASFLNRLIGGGGADRIEGTPLRDLIVGGNGPDRARGGVGNDRLRGGRGNDRLFGGPGKDRLNGGPGRDKLYGQAGKDILHGATGNDRAYGSAGNDRLYGGRGKDLLDGGAGHDRLSGGAGQDRLYGAAGNDRLYGGASRDYLDGGEGKDRLSGGAAGDLLTAGGGNDVASGGAGNDRIAAGTGVDRVYGGAGNDLLDTADGVADKRVEGGPGTDTCFIDPADRVNTRSCESLTLVGPRTGPPSGSNGGSNGSNGGPFRIRSISGTSCNVSQTCNFVIEGSGARGPAVKVAVGDSPKVLGSGSATVGAGGAWSARGNYLCLGDGAIAISSGTETLTVPLACKVTASLLPSDNGKLKITSPSGLTCTVGQTCTYSLSGTGADDAVAVVGVPGAAAIPGSSRVNSDGTWTATGTYTCTVAGQLAASDIRDVATIPVTCLLLGSGGSPDSGGAKLQITSPSSLTCKVGQTCDYALTGTGADGDTVVVNSLPGMVIVPGSQSSHVGADKTWTATGRYSCASAGQLAASDLADPTDVALLPVNCQLL